MAFYAQLINGTLKTENEGERERSQLISSKCLWDNCRVEQNRTANRTGQDLENRLYSFELVRPLSDLLGNGLDRTRTDLLISK